MKTQKLELPPPAGGSGRSAKAAPRGRGGAAAAGAWPHRVKRGAYERMMKILGWLQEGRWLNRSSLARELEVSPKTAGRDLEFLRERWQLPLEYDGRRHGFCLSRPVARLPGVPITEAELFALCVSHKVLERYQGLPFQKPLQLAFAKMTRCLDAQERYLLENLDLAFSFRPFAPEDPDLRLLELVTRAIAEGRGLRFAYRKPGQQRAEPRQVHPYHVLEYEGRLYLLAHDPARGALRTFALGRMRAPALTPARFVRPKGFDPAKEFGSSLGVMTGRGDYRVLLALDGWLTDILRGRRLHPSQSVEELPGGGSFLRLRLGGLEEVEQQVLSWGTHVTVLAPAELRERVAAVAREVGRRYGRGGGASGRAGRAGRAGSVKREA